MTQDLLYSIRCVSSDAELAAAACLLQRRDDNHHPLDQNALATARLLLLAWDGDKLVGCGAIKAGEGPVAELGYLVVDKAYRRKGLAERLTKARIAWARAHGISLLWATVRAENTPSRKNLIKAGWQFFGNYLSIRGSGNVIGWYVLPLCPEQDIAALMQGVIGPRQRVPDTP